MVRAFLVRTPMAVVESLQFQDSELESEWAAVVPEPRRVVALGQLG